MERDLNTGIYSLTDEEQRLLGVNKAGWRDDEMSEIVTEAAKRLEFFTSLQPSAVYPNGELRWRAEIIKSRAIVLIQRIFNQIEDDTIDQLSQSFVSDVEQHLKDSAEGNKNQ